MNRISTVVATNGEPVEIAIEQPIRREVTDRITLDEQASVFAEHADVIEDALFRSLPGGLYDRLLGRMLQRKASHFIVSHR